MWQCHQTPAATSVYFVVLRPSAMVTTTPRSQTRLDSHTSSLNARQYQGNFNTKAKNLNQQTYQCLVWTMVITCAKKNALSRWTAVSSQRRTAIGKLLAPNYKLRSYGQVQLTILIASLRPNRRHANL